MKNNVFVLFLFGMSILSNGLIAQGKDDKVADAHEKNELKLDAKSEKQLLKDEKAELKRIKNFEASLKNYDNALNKKHDAEVKLAKQNLKYEKAVLKGKADDAALAKLLLDIKKTEIAIKQADGDLDRYQRDIERYRKIED
ncbi:hypothetical protein EF405_01915 [Cyclobacteriaceae bacterium YHN15]|nr:hypothetical protein EF405_01915 [Cyclobacteriaceae bacterium YHN15]